MDIAIAAAVGVINVLWLFSADRYTYFLSWASGRAKALAGALLLLLGVLTGLAAVVVADQAGLQTGDGENINGVAAAVLLAAVLRADLGRQGTVTGSGAQSVAAPLARRLADAGDKHCARKVLEWACQLPDDRLVRAAQHSPGRDIVKGQVASQLDNADSELQRGGDSRSSARGRLERFIHKTYTANKFPKPPF